MLAEIDLNNFNNKQIIQYIKRLQATLEQYRAQEKASPGVVRTLEETSQGTHKTRGEATHAYSKGNGKVEDKESSDETSRSINWELVCVIQSFQKGQEEDFDYEDASPLSNEILTEPFPPKFKLPNVDKYDGTLDPRSHLAIFRTTMKLQDVNNFILRRVFPSTLTGLAQKWYQHLSPSSINNFTQLTIAFKSKFIACIPLKKLSSDL